MSAQDRITENITRAETLAERLWDGMKMWDCDEQTSIATTVSAYCDLADTLMRAERYRTFRRTADPDS